MKTLFIFLTGYCTAEVVTHLIFYFGKALPFTAFGMTIDGPFNMKALAFYAILALIFLVLALRK